MWRAVDKVVYECGALRIDQSNRRLTSGAIDIALEPKAFAVLAVLLERADDLVTRDELLDLVWGHRYITPATLNRVIAQLRRAFDDDADHPRLIQTVHGAGYRFIGAVRRVPSSRDELRARFGPPSIAKLPAKLDELVGRQRELAELAVNLTKHRAVTVIGPGGMGKTQCALEAARECAERFPDGVWFFDLSQLERAHEWLTALAEALSLPVAGTVQLLPRIARALSNRQALLVIDNCDRLATEVGNIVLALLRSCPEIRVLATSQRRLDFVGERLMWLPPLALPPPAADACRLPLEEIAAAPAVVLLLARASAVQPAFALSVNNVADVVEICRRLDGMPLALELAAAQFALLSPTAIRERLHYRLSVLASDSAGREPRHRTLHALVEWSYGLLSGQEQRLLCWLSVFLQGWTIDAAEQVGMALGMDEQQLMELHSGLILKSLVVVDPTLSPPRYWLLESVREFALQVLRARGEEADARVAHLRHFVRLAERSHREILDSRVDEWVERLHHEHANIDGALGWACAAGSDPDSALRLAGGLMLYARCNGQFWLMTGWIERALDGVAPQASATYVRALLCSGHIKLYVQDPAAESRLVEALSLAAQLRDHWAQGSASACLAMWNANQGRFEEARSYARVAADLADSDDWLRSLAGLAKGWIALFAGDCLGAIGALEPVRHVSFDLHQHQMVDMYLALSHHGLGNEQRAAELILDVFALSLRTRHLRSHAAVLEGTVYLAARTAPPDSCVRFLGKAADIRERTRTPLFSFWLAPHDVTTRLLREKLGDAAYATLYAAGEQARDELLVEEACAVLRRLVADQAPAAPA
jgi:non-specific serine/threonine protein kinase